MATWRFFFGLQRCRAVVRRKHCGATGVPVPCCRNLSRYVGQPTSFSHPELLNKDEILPGMKKIEFANRRKQLMLELSKTHSGMTNQSHLVIIPAATVRYMSNDVPYRFHQNNDFLYFTGFQEPDAVLLLESNPSCPMPDHNTTLYLLPRNPYREKWDGPRLGPLDAVELLGMDEAYDVDELSEHLEKRYSSKGYSVWYYADNQIPATISNSLSNLIASGLKKAPGSKINSVHSPLHHIQHMRLIKSPSELALMRKAGEIASDAFQHVMSLTHPGMHEYELESHFEHFCKQHGAQWLSFPPVVASGYRACHLHYITNNCKMSDTQMVLFDGGCEYYGYSSDITRTWPVNGEFTAAQRDLYEAVLRVKNTCIEECRPGVTLNYLHSIAQSLLEIELKELKIIPMNLNGVALATTINTLLPHDIGHYLGMDVHDCHLVDHNTPLSPGMVITIEPGIYVHPGFTISDSARAKDFSGVGIRIEDNVLVTQTGSEILNKNCPQTVQEITSTRS